VPDLRLAHLWLSSRCMVLVDAESLTTLSKIVIDMTKNEENNGKRQRQRRFS